MGAPHASTAERFSRHYVPEPNSGCWLWVASCNPRGYGQMWTPGQNAKKAHHVAFELHKGPIPPGMMVRHTCDVRCCVNPDHLLIGTAQDNVNDAVERDRHARGSKHGAAKLTVDQVSEIRASAAASITLARKFGVSGSLVCAIRRGRKWKP